MAKMTSRVGLLLISLSISITAVRDSLNNRSSIFLSQTENEYFENENFDGYEIHFAYRPQK